MRTKSQDIFFESSQCEYDVIVLVETWLNNDFWDEEFFDSTIFQVFRKDRDFIRTNCTRGGGVLVAVRRNIPAMQLTLPNPDSLLDQLCVLITGDTSLLIFASYIPPNSSTSIYDEHVLNVLNVAAEYELSEFVIFGDFNLHKLNWSVFPDSDFLYASNVNSMHEINLVDSFLSLNLGQINAFSNSLNRFLDLVFISRDIKFTVNTCDHPFYATDMHHIALELQLGFLKFPKIDSFYFQQFDYRICDFDNLNKLILDVNWINIFQNKSTDECYLEFISIINSLTENFIKSRRSNAHKLPWYTPGLKKLKNLRNKYQKICKSTYDQESEGLYKHYSREF